MISPTSSDYAEAIQNPQLTLSDARLRLAAPAQTLYGPRVYSGGFAAVFELHDATSRWAVRCFTHDTAGLRDRYRALASFLAGAPAPFFVPVEFIDHGIRVGARSWPVLLMPWVEGRALNDEVRQALATPARLQSIRSRLVTLATALEGLGVAHGDLQHGNILVREDGSLVLVDYDGMYLPEFAGQPASERGHLNYQHPRRTSTEFGPHLDRFSVAVIVTALEALERVPRLWEQFDNGENLLFRGPDFADPSSSELLSSLEASGLGHLADRITKLARLEPADLPSISRVLAGEIPETRSKPAPLTPIAAATPYQVVDLRIANASRFLGERVIVVGEITSTHFGTTRRGDPFAFVNLGGPSGEEIKVVLWSEVKNRLTWDLGAARGRVASVVGVLTKYQGRLQVELERAPLLSLLSTQDAERLLGSRWTDPPPSKMRLTHPRVGDVVAHSAFGRGRVDAVAGDTVTISFVAGSKRIQFTRFFLELLQAAPEAHPARKGSPAPTPRAGGLSSGRSRPPVVIPRPVQRGSAAVPQASIARSSADDLNRLFGATASSVGSGTTSPSGPAITRQPAPPTTTTPKPSSGLSVRVILWMITTAAGVAILGGALRLTSLIILVGMIVGAYLAYRYRV